MDPRKEAMPLLVVDVTEDCALTLGDSELALLLAPLPGMSM
jgi:hypothetical protein